MMVVQANRRQLIESAVVTALSLLGIGLLIGTIGYVTFHILNDIEQLPVVIDRLAGVSFFLGLLFGVGSLLSLPLWPVFLALYWALQKRFGVNRTVALTLGVIAAELASIVLFAEQGAAERVTKMALWVLPVGLASGLIFHRHLSRSITPQSEG